VPDPLDATPVRRHRWVWPVVGAAAWLVFSLVVLPYLVQGIYERRFLGFLHKAISPERHELAHYLDPCRQFALLGFGFAMTAWGLARLLAWPGFYPRFVAGGRPESLGAMRMLTAGILLVSALWEELPTSADLPRGMVKARGLIAILYALPGFDWFVTSAAALAVFQTSVVVLLLLACLGWRTRWTVPAAALGYLILGAIVRQYSWFYHTGLIPCLMLLVLSFTPCGDRWSLDHVLRSLRGRAPVPLRRPEVYAWGRYLCWCTLALPYVAAGLSKLRVGGLDWFSAESFRYWLYRDTLNPMEFDFEVSLWLASVGAPDALFTFLAICGAGGEVGYGLVLFHRYARVVFPAAMFTMHIGILLLQNVLFFDLILLQFIFVPWDRVLKALGLRLPGLGGVPVRAEASPAPEALPAGTGMALDPARSLRRLTWAVACVFIFCWVFWIDYYPVTRMSMYSDARRGWDVTYPRVYSVNASGERREARLGEAIGVMKGSRYRKMLRQARKPEKQELVQAFFEVCARRANHGLPPDERVVEYQVERWRWNYREFPGGPEHAERTGLHTYPVTGAAAGD
jgi:hypothetical protein